jgi:hypothetical protein
LSKRRKRKEFPGRCNANRSPQRRYQLQRFIRWQNYFSDSPAARPDDLPEPQNNNFCGKTDWREAKKCWRESSTAILSLRQRNCISGNGQCCCITFLSVVVESLLLSLRVGPPFYSPMLTPTDSGTRETAQPLSGLQDRRHWIPPLFA